MNYTIHHVEHIGMVSIFETYEQAELFGNEQDWDEDDWRIYPLDE